MALRATSSKMVSMADGELVRKYARIGFERAKWRYETSRDSEFAVIYGAVRYQTAA
jgi:hypothetical protein